MIVSNEDRSISQKSILWFSELSNVDVPLVGGKGASLGEMYNNLSPLGIKVPNGFCITASAFDIFIKPIKNEIQSILFGLDIDDTMELAKRANQVRELVFTTPLPESLVSDIIIAYRKLSGEFGEHNVSVAVRSSATAEDLPDASFAGQQESFLHVYGKENVLKKVHECMASLFTDRAISYRERAGFNHFDVKLSVTVQKMVNADEAVSGVIFTLDPNSGHKDVILISASYGLGELIVNGTVEPDEYLVFKPTLDNGFKATLQKKLGSKQSKLARNSTTGQKETLTVSRANRGKFGLTRYEINKLAKWALSIEKHYTKIRGVYSPMDIEFAKDADTGELFIVQARPETVQSQANQNVIHVYSIQTTLECILTGTAANSKISTGVVRVIQEESEMHSFLPGEILVTRMTKPDWEPIMKMASGMITEQGGRTCHAAIIAREYGITTIVGATGCLDKLATGDKITIDCSKGAQGYVYPGELPYEVNEIILDEVPDTITNIYVNVAEPEKALETAKLPVKGVGLLRTEFVLKNAGVHPLALINYNSLDEETRNQISALTSFYDDKTDYFRTKLMEGIAMVAAAFYPRPVIVRLSDLKSNEYSDLIGGKIFEPVEENPMLGWRGAARYADPKYRPAFDLECEVLRKVRQEMGLTNVKIMIPFCRTIGEAKQVLDILKENDLVRGQNGLEVYVMAELPTNCLRAIEFCELFDGFSIGSNDLTQLTLGIDRDSGLVSNSFSETDPAVLSMIRILFDQVREYEKRTGTKKYIGICGQGPSDNPDFAKFLVNLGINSLSFTSDTALQMLLKVAEYEKNI